MKIKKIIRVTFFALKGYRVKARGLNLWNTGTSRLSALKGRAVKFSRGKAVTPLLFPPQAGETDRLPPLAGD